MKMKLLILFCAVTFSTITVGMIAGQVYADSAQKTETVSEDCQCCRCLRKSMRVERKDARLLRRAARIEAKLTPEAGQ